LRQLKQTPLFPIGLAFFWYAFLLLAVLMFYGMQSYQNYIMNAYCWLMVGMLFRLPALQKQRSESISNVPSGTAR